MAQIVLSLGSNLGDSEFILNQTTLSLQDFNYTILKKSSTYITEPWGTEGQNFYNQCLLIEKDISPDNLLTEIHQIEHSFHRIRNTKYGPRTLDIDILFYNQQIISTEKLQIPHPLLHQRNFVLIPLFEILPNYVHPINHRTISQLKELCQDRNNVVLHT